MFNQITFQDSLVQEALKLPSFCRWFANDPYANSGFAKSGRRRFRASKVRTLVKEGYREQVAQDIVKDALDVARLEFLSDNGELS